MALILLTKPVLLPIMIGTKKTWLRRTLDIPVFWRKPYPACDFPDVGASEGMDLYRVTKRKADPVGTRVGLFHTLKLL